MSVYLLSLISRSFWKSVLFRNKFSKIFSSHFVPNLVIIVAVIVSFFQISRIAVSIPCLDHVTSGLASLTRSAGEWCWILHTVRAKCCPAVQFVSKVVIVLLKLTGFRWCHTACGCSFHITWYMNHSSSSSWLTANCELTVFSNTYVIQDLHLEITFKFQ
jgi:hypothetical protein